MKVCIYLEDENNDSLVTRKVYDLSLIEEGDGGIVIDNYDDPIQMMDERLVEMYDRETGFINVFRIREESPETKTKNAINEIEALKLMIADLALNQGGML